MIRASAPLGHDPCLLVGYCILVEQGHTLAVAEEGAAGGQTDILAFDNRAQTCKVCSVPEDFGI